MADLSSEGNKLGEILVIELVQDSHVLAVAEQPVDGGKVLALSQLLVQPPEHLTTGGRERGRGGRGGREGREGGEGGREAREGGRRGREGGEGGKEKREWNRTSDPMNGAWTSHNVSWMHAYIVQCTVYT